MECIRLINICNPSKDPAKRRAKPMMLVPCGNCINCTQRKAREWAFRLWHTNKYANHANFITFTYNNESLPINSDYTYAEFKKEDVINFMKRLRRRNDYLRPLPKGHPEKMKYYLTAEYGGQTGRPHYHAILFNSHPSFNKNMHKLWYETGDKKKRSMGNVHIDDVNMDTISYVAGYIMKRDIYKSDDLKREREFSIMSKGLGKEYIDLNRKYHQENLTFMTSFQGSPMAIPDHFRRQIFTDKQREQIGEETIQQQELDYNKKLTKLTEEGDPFPSLTLYEHKNQGAIMLKQRLTKDKF